jgi:predicted transcriptional regulator
MPRRLKPIEDKLQLVAGKVHPEIKRLVHEFAREDDTKDVAIVRAAIEDYCRRRLRRKSETLGKRQAAAA